MDDGLRLIALARLVRLSAEIEVQLLSPRHEPIKALLALAREDAAAAMTKLVDADPNRPDLIRALQNEARRYDALVAWLRRIVADGREAGDALDEEKSEEIRSLVLDLDDDTRSALGMKQSGAPTE